MARLRLLLILVLTGTLASGCSALWRDYSVQQRQGTASSLVEYLYPRGEIPPGLAPRIPHIQVPIRLGLAFVPANEHSRFSVSESHKEALLQTVRNAFQSQAVIQHIQLIPSHYLQKRGGFQDLRRVASTFNVDQIALVTYDQVGSVHENPLSLTYWTIVGAYIIPGNSHDVQTFIDTNIFDVKSEKLILRAAGQHRHRRLSPVVHLSASFRNASMYGFTKSTEQMIENLHRELELFKTRLRQGSKEVAVEYRPGFSGSLDLGFLALALLLVFAVYRRRELTR